MENGRHYDIVRAESEKRLIWLESAANLEMAKSRVAQLLSFWPGKYQIFDLKTKQPVYDTSRASSFLSSAPLAEVEVSEIAEIPQVPEVSQAGASL